MPLAHRRAKDSVQTYVALLRHNDVLVGLQEKINDALIRSSFTFVLTIYCQVQRCPSIAISAKHHVVPSNVQQPLHERCMSMLRRALHGVQPATGVMEVGTVF